MGLHEVAKEVLNVISDFRQGEIDSIDLDDVLRWSYQFPAEERMSLLSSLAAVFSHSYCSRAVVDASLVRMLRSKGRGSAECSVYWADTHLVTNQRKGCSQRELVARFRVLAAAEFGPQFSFGSHLSARHFYLDDAIFTGGRAKEDFDQWLGSTHIYRDTHFEFGFIAAHQLGVYFLGKHIEATTSRRPAGRKVATSIKACRYLENRKARRNSSQVLWPNQELASSVGGRYSSLEFRVGDGSVGGFWSEEQRGLLERAFMRAGISIIDSCSSVKPHLKPLGYSPFGAGFGSLFATYLNCPNNAPLALWWSVNEWHPLLRRRTNGDG